MTSPYLTAADAAAYLRMVSVQAFRCWARRQMLPTCRRGRTDLYLIEDLDAVVQRTRREQVAAMTRATTTLGRAAVHPARTCVGRRVSPEGTSAPQ